MAGTSANIEMEEITFSRVCINCGREFSFSVPVTPEIAAEAEALVARSEGSRGPLCDECATQRELDENAARERRREARLLEETGIPPEFTEYDHGKGNCKLASAIWRNRNRSLYICGNYATGKTRAAAAAAWKLAQDDGQKRGERVRFITFSDLANRYAGLRSEYSPLAADSMLDAEFDEPGIVVLDDIGKRRITATAGEMLLDIFDRLYSGRYKCRVWLTGNFTPADFRARFEAADIGDAVYSRIDRMIDDGRLVKLEAENG